MLKVGYWSTGYWCVNYWPHGYWPEYIIKKIRRHDELLMLQWTQMQQITPEFEVTQL